MNACDSAYVLDRAERGDYVAWIGATTVTTIVHLVRRSLGSEKAKEKIGEVTAICGIATVNRSVIESALRSPIADFEDAVQHEAAVLAGADCLVTRNEADFRHATIMVYSPRPVPRRAGASRK